MRKPA